MKRIIFTALILIGMISVQAQNREVSKPVYQNQLLIAPFHFMASTFMVSYERMMPNGNSALRITPSIMLSNIDDYYYFSDSYLTSREGFGLDVGYKVFLFENPRKINIYFGPYAMYRNMKRNYSNSSTEEINVWGIGVDTGIKTIFGRFVMDFTLGGGLRNPIFEGSNTYSSSGIFDDKYKGITPRVNFVLGMTF